MTINIKTTKHLVLALMHGRIDMSGKALGPHSIRVADEVQRLFGDATEFDVNVMHAALLHDVVEDTIITLGDLIQLGYESRVIGLVNAVTKDDAENYEDYIARVCKSADWMAVAIKLADNIDNTNRIAQLPTFALREWARKRYGPAQIQLVTALERRGIHIEAR